HPLQALLQLQLGSDSYAVLHLPYILASLTADSLVPSPHSSKWTARINSLLHSKSPDARWAGLCLAHRSSVLAKNMMVECAQGWIGITLPILSKKESSPILSACVRLLRVIFSAATDMPEYQRQVATPNVAKFTAALISLAEKHPDIQLKILILSTLALIIPLYPTLHRTSHATLSALCLGFLNGDPFRRPNKSLTGSASRLYALLPFTGGKVGAPNLWRKSVDDTLSFGWTSFVSLRSTFPAEARLPQLPTEAATQDPLVSVPLSLDRLRCCITVICDLLTTTTHRPVQVPLGSLTKFALALLSCVKDEKVDHHIDKGVRAMEAAVTPQIWKMACDLLTCLANCVHRHLTPDLARIVACITFHLEQNLTTSERLPFLNTLQVVLTNCHPLHSTLIVNRLARAVLPSVSLVLAKQARDTETDVSNRHKKSRKRTRGFEGDEIFKISREVVCPTVDDGKLLLAAFAVLRLVLRNSNLSPALQSISCRVILSVLLSLPQMPPALLSSEPKLHPLLLERVQEMSIEFGTGSTEGMSMSLGLVVGACFTEVQVSGQVSTDSISFNRDLEVLLHPRLPPLVRSLPYIEALSLFRAEESQEESDAREGLGLVPSAPAMESITSEVLMSEAPTISSPSRANTSKSSDNPPQPRVLPQNSLQMVPPNSRNAEAEKPPMRVLSPQLPMPSPLVSAPSFQTPAPSSTKVVKPSPVDAPMFVEENENNEEMPTIDMDSDSDSE
ncbi:rRNA processing/ribosome biogenesis-domain-containing protein, partial [Mycena pura]